MQLKIDELLAERVIPADDSVRLLDHMRSTQLKPWYNVQLGAEGEYITGAIVSSHRNDTPALIPLLTQMELHLGTAYGDVTADTGYESEENNTWFNAHSW